MTLTPLSSCDYVGPNNLCVYLPPNPVDKQRFLDDHGNVWVYDAVLRSWIDTKTRNIPVADGTNVGLLSSTLKSRIDELDRHYGGFGFIVDSPYTRKVVGGVKLTSNSIDIKLASASGTVLSNDCESRATSLLSVEGNIPQIQLSIKPEYLENLVFYYPAPNGKQGKQGPKGRTGEDGNSPTPRGVTGKNGPDLINVKKMVGIVYIDLDELSEESIARIDITNTDQPTINITKSNSPLETNEPASSLIGSPISRALVYNNDLTQGCDLNGLNDYTITRVGFDDLPIDVDLMRLSDDRTETSAGHAERLSGLIDSIAQHFEMQLIDIDNKYAEDVKQYVERIDAIARNNLAALADQLNDCERRLESEDWSLSFTRCPSYSPASVLLTPSGVSTSSVSGAQDGQDYIVEL